MAMLYLCRHAIAEDAREGQADADRALTPAGARKFRRAARGLVKLLGVRELPLILTSPLLRARQTATLLAEEVEAAKGKTEIRVSESLAPDGSLQQLLKEARGERGVVAVGHEPTLSEWAGALCFGTTGRLMMKKGAVAAIELAETGARGELVWLMQPGMLRTI